MTTETYKDTSDDPNMLPAADLRRFVTDNPHGKFLGKVLEHAQNNQLEAPDEPTVKAVADRAGYDEFLA